MQVTGSNMFVYGEYSWMAIVTLSLGFILLYQYALLTMEDRETAFYMYKHERFWIIVSLLYFMLIFTKIREGTIIELIFRQLHGMPVFYYLKSIDLRMVGITGFAFCAFWLLRERILIYRQKILIEKINSQYDDEAKY
jgi:hypothetical protein